MEPWASLPDIKNLWPVDHNVGMQRNESNDTELIVALSRCLAKII